MIETQEPEEESVYYAPHLQRLLAFIIDIILASVLASVILQLTGGAPRANADMSQAEMLQAVQEFQETPYVWVVIGVLITYYALFQISSWQATPGKKLFGLYVTNLEGERLNLTQSIWRAAVEVGNFIILGGLPAILALFHPHGQTAHDVIARTYVLKR
jgi:uncharacterized RDD family membrane protein YckC